MRFLPATIRIRNRITDAHVATPPAECVWHAARSDGNRIQLYSCRKCINPDVIIRSMGECPRGIPASITVFTSRGAKC